MGRWSRPLARKFVEWLRPPASAHWLEVGCGTGALTSAICDGCEPATVLACDPSAQFLDHARTQVSDDSASFVVAGAEALPHRQGGFGLAVSGLVLNFLPEPLQVATSIRQRLHPGGTFAAYVWDYSEGMEFLRAFWEEAIAADPHAATRAEHLGFPLCRPPALVSLLETAGFAHVQVGSLEIPTDFANFDDYWLPFLRGTGTGPSFVTSLDPSGRDLLRDRLKRRLEPGSDGRIGLRARAWAVRGLAG